MNYIIYLTIKKDNDTMNKDKCFECTLWKEVGILTVAICVILGAMLIVFT